MKRSHSLAAMASAIVMALPTFAIACISAADRSAFELNAMQSRLMVVALTCRDRGGAEYGYNQVVLRFRDGFKEAHDRVMRHFVNHGGMQRFDSYSTGLANDHSQQTMAQGPALCWNYASWWQKLGQINTTSDLLGFAARSGSRGFSDMAVCHERSQPAPAYPATNSVGNRGRRNLG
jgi:hypothetical protein